MNTGMNPDMAIRFCTDCGTALNQGEPFCTECGAHVASTAPPPGLRRADRSWRFLGGAVITVVIIICIAALLGRDSGGSESKSQRSSDARAGETSDSTSEPVRSTTTTTRMATTTTTRVERAVAGLDRWVAVLASIPTSLPRAEVDAEVDRVRSGVARITHRVRSDDFGSMRPGYWVVYVASFNTADQATEYCRSISRAVPDQCYPKFLSR